MPDDNIAEIRRLLAQLTSLPADDHSKCVPVAPPETATCGHDMCNTVLRSMRALMADGSFINTMRRLEVPRTQEMLCAINLVARFHLAARFHSKANEEWGAATATAVLGAMLSGAQYAREGIIPPDGTRIA